MKKIICLSIIYLLAFIAILPTINRTTVQARPVGEGNQTAPVPKTPAVPHTARELQHQVFLDWLARYIERVERKAAYNSLFSAPRKISAFKDGAEDDLVEYCKKQGDEILKQLDELGAQVDELAENMARAAGKADDVIRSPAFRRTFNRTMTEIGRRLGTRALRFLAGPLGWILDLIAILVLFDQGVENHLMEDLMANNPALTEDEARTQANHLSDIIAHNQIAIESAMPNGAGLSAMLHLYELHSEQRTCGVPHNRGKEPGRPPHHNYDRRGIRQYEADGGVFGSYTCYITGPAAMPDQPPGNEPIPRIDGGTITVTTTALPPCP